MTTNKHNWECISQCISPGMYDSLYECKKCKVQHTELVDNLDSKLPTGGCPKKDFDLFDMTDAELNAAYCDNNEDL